MNYPITDEQRMILDSLRAFLVKEIFPHEAETDRAGIVPVELGEDVLELGVVGEPLGERVAVSLGAGR